MHIPTDSNSSIEVRVTDKNFIVIKQTKPQIGEIGFPISSADYVIGLIKQAVIDSQPPSDVSR